MAAHSECEGFKDDRTGILSEFFGPMVCRMVYFKYVVAIDLNGFHAIANAFVDELFAAKLFVRGGAESVTVVLNEEDHGQLPNGSHIEGFVKIAF